jgi:hypothetical protein
MTGPISPLALALSLALTTPAQQAPKNYVFVDSTHVIEGSGGGTTPMIFRIRLISPARGEVKVDYATTTYDSTSAATPGVDFEVTKGTATIPAGRIVHEVIVPIVADDEPEGNEFVQLTISNPRNAVIIKANATGTIVDDD